MLKTPTTLSDLHEDAWMIVMQFLPLDELLCKEKLFGISARIFSTLIGCEIHEHFTCYNSNHDGGLFYRVLNEKLISKQLENSVTRINRNFLYYYSGDYDDKTNSYNFDYNRKLLGTKPRRENTRGKGRYHFYSRSRLNIEPCGTSMSKLRCELKQLIETCYVQFPHVYEKMKLEIENSLRKSIRVCSPIVIQQLSDKDVEKGFKYHDNSERKKNKPAIWNQSKREESVILELKKSKLKHIKWRTQWSHNYRNYLLHELEYYVAYLEAIYQYSKTKKPDIDWSPIMYTDALNSLYDTLSKFNEPFQIRFLTERNFYIKKSKKRYGVTIQVPEIDRSQLKNIDFISHSTHALVKLYKYFENHYDETDVDSIKEILNEQIDRNMTLYAKYFEHDLFREVNLRRTIYHYLLIPAERDLVEKHFTQKVIDSAIESSEPIQTTLVLSFLEASIPDFKLLSSLKFSLNFYSFKQERSISLLEELFDNLKLTDTEKEYYLEEWLQFFIDYFGIEELKKEVQNAKSSIDYFVKYCDWKYVNVAKQLLGDIIDTDYRRI